MTNLDWWASILEKMDEALFRRASGFSYTSIKACTLIGLCCLKYVRCPRSTNLPLALHRQEIKNRVLEIYGLRFNKENIQPWHRFQAFFFCFGMSKVLVSSWWNVNMKDDSTVWKHHHCRPLCINGNYEQIYFNFVQET